MQVIYARQSLADLTGPVLFLAGPTPRSAETPSWRPAALQELAETLNFTGTVLVPEDQSHTPYIDYDHQIEWEWEGLDAADAIVFWVPRELATMPAFTTNIEFGMYWNSGKVVLGFPPEAPKMRYLERLAGRGQIPVEATLSATLAAALAKVG